MISNLNRRRLISAGLGLAAVAAVPRPVFARSRAGAHAPDYDGALDAVFAEKVPVALGGCVVTADGVQWTGVRGVRRSGADDPVTIGERWHIGSNGKALTAALYARLVDQGRTRWDATVPELFADVRVDPAWSRTTIGDLMRHRAGLADAAVLDRQWLMTARRDPATLVDQRTALAAKAFGQAPTGTPGTFAYGNADYVMMGAAIERLTNGSWEDAMTREVFAPLGLDSAGFGAPHANAEGGANAWGHLGPVGSLVPMDPTSPGADNPRAMSPAGGVHMTLADYAAFLRAVIRKGGGWLSPEAVDVLVTPPEEGEPYAGGWGIRRNDAGEAMLGHEGSNTLWHVSTSLDLTAGIGFVGVVNQGPKNGAPRNVIQALRKAATA